MIIDGHNDLVLRSWRGEPVWHVDLARAAEADFSGGFFAIYVPSPHPDELPEIPYSMPLAARIATEEAARVANELYATLLDLPVTLATSVDDFKPGRVTAIAHLEGADPLAPDLSDLERWYERGIRSIGPVWSRPNAFGEGVPFAFPSSPDLGKGLSPAGFELVRVCNRLGILVDLSHLNEQGFWDVAEASCAPLVASHSNVHALCPSSRNLTDRQLDAIGKSGGIVGINFAVTFLRADGDQLPDETPLKEIVRHVDYIAKRIGIDHVAFGSDFDGAVVPTELDGIAGFPKLVAALGDAGYDDDALAKITHVNWLRVLDATWK
ncbi:MAG TPA: dipeptidase [Gaiellaceae bacterium]